MKIPVLVAVATVLIVASSSLAQAIPQRGQLAADSPGQQHLPQPVRDVSRSGHDMFERRTTMHPPSAAQVRISAADSAPANVRTASIVRPTSVESVVGEPAVVQPVSGIVYLPSSPAHRVIVSPETSLHSPHRRRSSPAIAMNRLSHRRPIQPEPAVIPTARRSETWKTPYSYGHFGASRTRQWTLHYGYRDRTTEWRLQ